MSRYATIYAVSNLLFLFSGTFVCLFEFVENEFIPFSVVLLVGAVFIRWDLRRQTNEMQALIVSAVVLYYNRVTWYLGTYQDLCRSW